MGLAAKATHVQARMLTIDRTYSHETVETKSVRAILEAFLA